MVSSSHGPAAGGRRRASLFGSGKLEYYLAAQRPGLEVRGVDAFEPVANLHRCYLRRDPVFLRSLLRLVGRRALLLRAPPAGRAERPCRAPGRLRVRPAAQQLLGKVWYERGPRPGLSHGAARRTLRERPALRRQRQRRAGGPGALQPGRLHHKPVLGEEQFQARAARSAPGQSCCHWVEQSCCHSRIGWSNPVAAAGLGGAILLPQQDWVEQSCCHARIDGRACEW